MTSIKYNISGKNSRLGCGYNSKSWIFGHSNDFREKECVCFYFRFLLEGLFSLEEKCKETINPPKQRPKIMIIKIKASIFIFFSLAF
jgi:hypothetical protein